VVDYYISDFLGFFHRFIIFSILEKTTGRKDSLGRVQLARVAIQAAQYVGVAPISEKGKAGWDF